MPEQGELPVQDAGLARDSALPLNDGNARANRIWTVVAFVYFVWILYTRITPNASSIAMLAAVVGIVSTLAGAIMYLGQSGSERHVVRCTVTVVLVSFTVLALEETLRSGLHFGPWLMPGVLASYLLADWALRQGRS